VRKNRVRNEEVEEGVGVTNVVRHEDEHEEERDENRESVGRRSNESDGRGEGDAVKTNRPRKKTHQQLRRLNGYPTFLH